MNTLQILGFFLMRPRYYPELLRRIRKRVGAALLPAPMGRGRRVAEQWAAERAVDVDTALARLEINAEQTLAALFPDVTKAAQKRAAECPVEMGGGGAADLLFRLARHLQAKRVVETGVAYGFSSLALLLALKETGGKLASVDMPYPGRGNEKYVGCAVPEDLRTHWELLRYPDSIGLPKALVSMAGEVDLVHYDSDKSYEGRSWAYPLIWAHIRPGGIFVSDDVDDNTAFRDFAAELELEPVVANAPGGGGSGSRNVGILIKPVSDSKTSGLLKQHQARARI